MPYRGRCLCGAVVFELERSRLAAMHCHCTMCQRAHGTAYSTHVLAKANEVRWVAGREWLTTYRSSEEGTRQFCSRCGSQIVAADQAGAGFWGIPVGLLEDDPELRLLGHMYTADRRRWVNLDDGLPRHSGWPPGTGPTAQGPGA